MSPVLNLKIEHTQSTDPNAGRRAPSGQGLLLHGPRTKATLLARFPGHPDPVEGPVLIDTGALVTCVDRHAAEQAGLSIVGSGRMSSATHENEVVPVYAGRLRIAGFTDIDLRSAYGAHLRSQGIIALIGRDVLRNCTFFYNGAEGTVSLAR